MTRVFCKFGIIVLLVAFVLQFLVSISLPFLDSFDIVRVHINSGITTISQLQGSISELRLGVWAYCVDNVSVAARTCDHTGHGYSVGVAGPATGQVAHIHSSWTKGLAVHPVATAVIFIAFLFSFSTHLTLMLIASLVSFLAALITLIAFAIDIALFALTKNEVHKLGGVSSHTDPGPGFWITLTTFLLLLIAGFTVCFGRRRVPHPTTSKVTTVTPSEKVTTITPSEKITAITPSEKKRPFWRRWRRTAY